MSQQTPRVDALSAKIAAKESEFDQDDFHSAMRPALTLLRELGYIIGWLYLRARRWVRKTVDKEG